MKSVPTIPLLPYDMMSRRVNFCPTSRCHITSTSFVALECHMTLNGHIFIKNYGCSNVQLYAP